MPFVRASFKCCWTDLTKRRVPASLVIEHFDVVEQLHLRVPYVSNRSASSLSRSRRRSTGRPISRRRQDLAPRDGPDSCERPPGGGSSGTRSSTRAPPGTSLPSAAGWPACGPAVRGCGANAWLFRSAPGFILAALRRGLLAGRRPSHDGRQQDGDPDGAQRETSGRPHTEGALLGEHEPCVQSGTETADVPAQRRGDDSGCLGSAAPPVGGGRSGWWRRKPPSGCSRWSSLRIRLPRPRHGTWRGGDCDCGELLRLEMWRRSLESVGHGGVGSSKHRGDQRGKVEVPLVSRPHDAGEHLLGVGPVAGAIAAADCEHDRAGARPVLTPPQTDFVSWQGSVGPAGQHASRCCLAGRAVTE